MPSKTDTRDAAPAANVDDLENYFLDSDLDNDPFASPKAGDKADSSNKRKEPGDGLGIDEEVSVAKKARAPRIKLDQERLLSEKGIPALRRRAQDLKLKGKGHEWGDASRLLSFYQEWLDDLFPKAKFLDALAMVEKAGHNKMMHKMRVDWINEGKPKSSVAEDGGDAEPAGEQQETEESESAPKAAERIAPIFEKAAASGSRTKTPEADDLWGEDDIYNATPIGVRKATSGVVTGGEPDEDELDALMAEEEEAEAGGLSKAAKPAGGVVKSIFGDGKPRAAEKSRLTEPEEDDDLDALVAEAEAEQSSGLKPGAAAHGNTGNGKPAATAVEDEDDLDALMAEAEAEAEAQPRPAKPAGGGLADPKPSLPEFNDEEEAMAEMEGLW